GRLRAGLGGNVERRQVPGSGGPGPEGARVVCAADVDEPGVDVHLAAGGRGAAAVAEVSEEAAGGGEFGAGPVGGPGLQGRAVETAAEAAEQVGAGEQRDERLVAGVSGGGEGSSEGLQAEQVLVAGGQRSGGDEESTQVVDGAAGAAAVEGVMRHRQATGGEVG